MREDRRKTVSLEPARLSTLKQVLAKRSQWRRHSEKIVFTNGCFDILHLGHVTYLEKARRFGDRLIVGLNSDASVRRIKGPERPIHPEFDRAGVLAALRCVDAIVIFDEDTPEDLIRAIKPDVLVKGADWKKNQIAGGTFVESYGGKVKRIPLVPGRSTTASLKRSKNKK